ncbi:MAG TPA: hypothetical protein VI796_00905 [Candidatus Thermoplasmatota archaeon]|nr:hypothetical protein [Candidatus Thermoplasmatota archaeon]
MVHLNETASVAAIALVALISLVLTILAHGAWRRTRNRKLAFVAAAFALFFVKSAITAYSLPTRFIHHEDLELVGAFLDLGVVALLAAPFLVRP